MVQDINSRVYLVRFISGEIVKLLEVYKVDCVEVEKILNIVERKMEIPQERA